MTTRTYGFARPANYDQIKPGMLISADRHGQRVIGLAFQAEREMLVAVFQHDGDAAILPYVLDLSDIHQTLTVIEGERELEPIGENYALLPRSRPLVEGFVITSGGGVGLTVKYNDFGNVHWKVLDFDTGADLTQSGRPVSLPPSRLFIREPGRDERR